MAKRPAEPHIRKPQRWPIERTWTIRRADDSRQELKTRELGQFGAVAALGSAGAGKTFELSYLAGVDVANGLDARFHRLALLGQSVDGLENALTRIAAKSSSSTVLYLDALDEV